MKKCMETLLLLFLISCVTVNAEPVGSKNPDVTQANIRRTVCVPHYTDSIRPLTSYTNKLKVKQIKELHLQGLPKSYELDHYIPLSLGGSPTNPDNLWPQVWSGPKGARSKDKLETLLHRKLCNNKITLAEGQECFINGWLKCYKLYY